MYKFISTEKKHIHTFDEKPLIGTTTLIKELMPPPLAWYGSGKALELFGWTNPKIVTREEGVKLATKFLMDVHAYLPATKETEQDQKEAWYDFLQKCYRNHDESMKKAGDWGKKTHKAIEEAINKAINDNAGFLSEKPYDNEAVERFATWGRGKNFVYSEIHCYSEKLWLGGIMDFVYREEDKFYIGDTKTSKSIYPDNFIQMGLYDYQQTENGFYSPQGLKIGESVPISGYTVVNVSKAGGLNVKTYRGTEELKNFASNLVALYKTKQNLETICRKN